MRLMEVDEAASHIKELVDPDANIIWGSAFNNDLGGKLRVSVVATGIEAETVAQAQPGKVFTFPATSRAATAAPVAADEAAGDDDLLDLASGDDGDELLLDPDDILTSPVSGAPIAPPADDDDTIDGFDNLTGDDLTGDDPVPPKAVRESGTLFERMSNIARGAAKAQGDGEEEAPEYRREPIDIPRFLNRQNNQ
jgi:cell division protein FtsZ